MDAVLPIVVESQTILHGPRWPAPWSRNRNSRAPDQSSSH